MKALIFYGFNQKSEIIWKDHRLTTSLDFCWFQNLILKQLNYEGWRWLHDIVFHTNMVPLSISVFADIFFLLELPNMIRKSMRWTCANFLFIFNSSFTELSKALFTDLLSLYYNQGVNVQQQYVV